MRLDPSQEPAEDRGGSRRGCAVEPAHDGGLYAGHCEALGLLLTNNVSVRDDGLGGWPYGKGKVPFEAWPMALMWHKGPVLFEGSGRGGGVYGWRRQGKDPAAVLDWVIEHSPPTYLNIAGSESGSEKAIAELGDLLNEYGRKIGYRFVLRAVRHPISARSGGEVELQTVWFNTGAAPCYTDQRIEVVLTDKQGDTALRAVVLPKPSTREWGPNRQTIAAVRFDVPKDLDGGEYTMRLKMLTGRPLDPDRAVPIASEGADAEGRFEIGPLYVRQ